MSIVVIVTGEEIVYLYDLEFPIDAKSDGILTKIVYFFTFKNSSYENWVLS